MSNVKLHINITQGIIDAEGDQEFVWRVYEDFRDRLGSSPVPTARASVVEDIDTSEDEASSAISPSEAKPKKRQQRRKAATINASSPSSREKPIGITTHKPRLLPDLDTTGIKEFIGEYMLTNNRDTIVAMAKFLETKGVKPASLDAFFTCFKDAGLKVPVAFGQAFVDTRNKRGFLEFSGPDDITLTIRGDNHIDHGGIKKVEA